MNQKPSQSRFVLRGPRIIAVAGNRGHLWGEQHRIETRTKRNHSRVNSEYLTLGGNYSRSPLAIMFPSSNVPSGIFLKPERLYRFQRRLASRIVLMSSSTAHVATISLFGEPTPKYESRFS